MTKIDRSEALASAKRLIDHLKTMRDEGTLPEVDLDSLQELMGYLRALADSNALADGLESICAAAIISYRKEEYARYFRYLVEIIRVGEQL